MKLKLSVTSCGLLLCLAAYAGHGHDTSYQLYARTLNHQQHL
ncbi:hypothetical protein [Chitinophaga fulva]|nr:hypothetical protein [Chitinophaga fulva]